MVAGAPRTVSPSPEECIKLGKELVEWVTEDTDEWRCLFQQWYSLKKGILRKEWKAMVQVPEFLPYYEQAQAALATKAVDGTMKDTFGHRYIRLYDRQLVEEENDEAQEEVSRKKQIIDYEAEKKTQALLKESPEQSNLDKDDMIARQQAEIIRLKEKLKNADE